MYPVTYRRSLDEQGFWDLWADRLREVLTGPEFTQIGIDVRTVMRTQWWTWNEQRRAKERTEDAASP